LAVTRDRQTAGGVASLAATPVRNFCTVLSTVLRTVPACVLGTVLRTVLREEHSEGGGA
jgi:hypothetical protein